jgi:hypothetical protein
MWLDDEALSDHFESVKRRLKSGHGSGDWEDIEETPNEITRDLRRR